MDLVRAEWARGWPTVVSGTLGMAVMTGVSSVTGIVMAPLQDAFGWPRAVVAANVFICSVMGLVLAPAAGGLIARFGVRRLALASVAASAPALVLIGMTGPSAWTWYMAWFLFAIINVGIGPMVWSTAVAGLFDRARGVALAVTLSGGGVAFLLFPPVAVLALGRFGWRGVYFTIALIALAGLLPLIFAFFRGRDDIMAASSDSRSADQGPSGRVGYTLAEALRTRHFWQLALLSLLIALVEGAMMVHLYPILNEGGLAPAVAAGLASTMGLAIIVGRLLTGVLMDRLPAPQVFAGSILLILLSCLAARTVEGSALTGGSVAVLLGLGAGGTTNALAYLSGRYFGLAAYASIFGLLMGIFSIGFGIAPAVVGHLRDVFASYGPIFLGLASSALLAGLLATALGRPPPLAAAAP